MDRTPEELETEVREKRADVEQTIDALRAKMSIGQIVDELSSHMKGDDAQAFFANAGRQVRDNPLALGLIGAGFAWLATGDGVRRNAGDAYDRYSGDDRDGMPARSGARSYGTDESRSKSAFAGDTDTDDGGGEGMADRIDAAYGSAKDAAGSASDRVSGAFSDGRDRARESMRDARQGAARYGDRAQDGFMRMLEEQPLVLGALAVAVGTAIGAALPATRTEDELMGEHRDRLRDEAGDYLGRKGAEAADAVEKTYDKVKGEARKQVEDATGESHSASVSSSSEKDLARTT